MAIQQATLFHPVTGKRIAVPVGGQEAQTYFSQGYKLETPTQTASTWSATPSREVAVAPDKTTLFNVNNTAGTGTRLLDYPALSQAVVSGGVQDTRRMLSFDEAQKYGYTGPSQAGTGASPSGASGAGAGYSGGTGSGAGAGTGSGMKNYAEEFNRAMRGLLVGMAGQGDEDLLAKRNELIQARFNTVNEPTPDALRVLAPNQQGNLRSQYERALETQLTGVNTAIQGRQQRRTNATTMVENVMDDVLAWYKEQNQVAKDNMAVQNQLRDDARASLQFVLGQNPDAIRNMTDDQKRQWETSAGYVPGTLMEYGTPTLKEQSITQDQAEKQGLQFIRGTANQKAGYWDPNTQTFKPLAGAYIPSKNSTGTDASVISEYADHLVQNYQGTITQGPGDATSHGKLDAYDVALPYQTPLYSPFTKGTVTEVGTYEGNYSDKPKGSMSDYGNYVKVRNNETGREILLGHMSSIAVKKGEQVDSASLIGLSGNTGYVLGKTGMHVHIENVNAGAFAKSPKADTTKMTERERQAADLSELDTWMKGLTGKDGFVSPETFNAARNAWLKSGWTRSQFDSAFLKYVNRKADPTVGDSAWVQSYGFAAIPKEDIFTE